MKIQEEIQSLGVGRQENPKLSAHGFEDDLRMRSSADSLTALSAVACAVCRLPQQHQDC
jgi:hypothetical protein